jgi:pimeloyl-ACP methyl ester carboxylesterase
MGEEDYMFLPSVRKVVEKHFKFSQLFVVQQCGHVVNIEQPLTFNSTVISFLNKL